MIFFEITYILLAIKRGGNSFLNEIFDFEKKLGQRTREKMERGNNSTRERQKEGTMERGNNRVPWPYSKTWKHPKSGELFKKK
jgi:hypothetical protein